MRDLTIRPAEHYDLRAINLVIESAVMNWPAANRFKRLAVTPLQYREADLAHYEMLVAEFRGEVVGVAAWEVADCSNGIGTFHGLFVLPILQQQGIGRFLMDAVFRNAGESKMSGLIIKAHRLSRSYFEYQGLEARPANEDEYPYQYWKQL